MATILNIKKKQKVNLKDQFLKPNQIKIEKDLLLEISLTNQA